MVFILPDLTLWSFGLRLTHHAILPPSQWTGQSLSAQVPTRDPKLANTVSPQGRRLDGVGYLAPAAMARQPSVARPPL